MNAQSSLAVTTGTSATGDNIARAHHVAARCEVPFIARRGSLARTCARAGVEMLYVVERQRESLRMATGERIGVDQGMLATRRHAGHQHPLIRATAVDGLKRVMDGTLGLGHDALHLASVWERPVLGAEASPVVFSLLEAGLNKLSDETGLAATAARYIEPHFGRSAEILAGVDVGSVDVLLLAPMFQAPRNAAPGYPLFRQVAVHDPVDEATLQAASDAGVRRIVLKLDRGTAPPSVWKAPRKPCISGKANTYWIWDL